MRQGVFISYSHRDHQWLEELKPHLNLYVGEHPVSFWEDTQIQPGANWLEEIKKALATAKVAVLLVSKHFLNSKFINTEELPVIHEAFKAGELRILWIVLSSCGYEKTFLADCQAAHKVERPLDSLEKHEWEAALHELCKKIEIALYGPGAGQPQVTQPAGMKTRYEAKRCDRGHYINRLARLLNANLTDRPGLPQVYLIFGDMGQSHDNFVERIYREVVKPKADRASGSPLQGVQQKADVRWPDPVGSIQTQQEDLQIELSNVYSENQNDYRPTFPASEFVQLPNLSRFQFIIVKHKIHLGAGAGADWATSRELLTWYLQTYWTEAVTTLEQKNGDSPRPQFLIFIKVSYETPGLLERVIPSTSAKFDKGVVKAELEKLAEETNINYPCVLLDELLTPPYPEVIRWYTDNGIYNDEQDALEAAIRLYKTHGPQLSMLIIEKELGKCFP